MAYIGNSPVIGNFQVCDAISVVNGQASYTMQVSSANVTPESANHMLVSLNGILQKPGSSFTISGSTITFASNLATGDVIDFIILLGNVLDLGVPSDATVTDAKTNFVSTSSGAGLQIKGDGTTDGTLQLNCRVNSHGIKLASPPHSAGQSYTLTFPTGNVTADKFLKVASVSGSGTTGVGQLSFADAGGGMFEFISSTDVTSDVAQVDFTSFSTDYSDFKLIVQNLHIENDNQNPEIRYFNNAGSIVTGSFYDFTYHGYVDGSANENTSANQDRLRLAPPIGNASHESAHLEITFFDVHDTGDSAITEGYKMTMSRTAYINNGGAVGISQGAGFSDYNNSGNYSISGIRFFMSGGNIKSGRFSLYGRKHS